MKIELLSIPVFKIILLAVKTLYAARLLLLVTRPNNGSARGTPAGRREDHCRYIITEISF
jgi:hypothetical protein